MPQVQPETISQLSRSAFKAAVRTAIVSAVGAATVTFVLLLNLAKTHPLQSPGPTQMSQTRQELHGHKAGDATRAIYRQADLEVRREYFFRLRFARMGGYLLIGFASLAAASGLIAFRISLRIKAPTKETDLTSEQIRGSSLSIWVTVAFTSLLAVGGGVLVSMSRSAVTPSVLGVASQVGLEASSSPSQPSYPGKDQIAANWHRFRGPGGNAVVSDSAYPTSWDGAGGKGILWQQFIPMQGQNSPVVWEGRVFLTGADRTLREVYCYDTASGKLLWQKQLDKVPGTPPGAPGVSSETGFAASTAATDGKRVYAIFANGDLAAFDFEGNQVWARNLGMPESMYGYATSLVTYKGLLLVQYDQGSEDDDLSELIAFDGPTGKQLWVIKRPVSDSWATPIVAATPGADQLVTCARPWVIAYKPATGEEIWRANCLDGDIAPSPIYAGGFVFVVVPNMTIYAIRPDGVGDVTETHIAWQAEEGAPDITSPVSDGEILVMLTTQGLLTCYSVSDGAKFYEHQFEGTFMSSPTIADGLLYVMDHQGLMYVLDGGSEFRLVSKAQLGQKSTCSPAFVGGRIYIRGEEDLYCIGREAQ